mmetsp:Transcript_45306/g.38152  ORF Transcript_45306/g.38152 Transcript_45306/m.38152 type:complete len:209 (-) Transcript_45306:570-1196(-)
MDGKTAVYPQSWSAPGEMILAPFASASARSSARYWGFEGSGRGVMSVPASHGSPSLRLPTFAVNFCTNSSATSLCTIICLMAVHRWPLYDSAPRAHSATALSMSASLHTIATFFASSERQFLRRWGQGCAFTSASAAFEVPMKAKISTLPVAMMGGMVSRPAPEMKLTTPLGKHSAKASMVSMCASAPTLGIFITAVLPMMMAGMRVV